jgi:hypothetical protein
LRPTFRIFFAALGLNLVDLDLFALEGASVQGFYGGIGLGIIGHVDKTEIF